jgi:hypothetical protein
VEAPHRFKRRSLPEWRRTAFRATRRSSIPEFVWRQAKRELANTDHDGLVPLTLHVVRSLQRIGRSQPLLRSCLHASDLPWP